MSNNKGNYIKFRGLIGETEVSAFVHVDIQGNIKDIYSIYLSFIGYNYSLGEEEGPVGPRPRFPLHAERGVGRLGWLAKHSDIVIRSWFYLRISKSDRILNGVVFSYSITRAINEFSWDLLFA
jgi:hypothetical protein